MDKTDHMGAQHEEELINVSDVMTGDVHLIEPTQTIREAVRLMSEIDVGIMPVREGDRLVGMITDHRGAGGGPGQGP